MGTGHRRLRALGTGVVVETADPSAVGRAVELVTTELERVDRACSRFRADSELERVNAANGVAVEVGPVLLEAVRLAVEAAWFTAGDLDPTVGSAVRVLGYDRDFSLVSPDGPPVVGLRIAEGWRTIELDLDRSTIRIPAGARLDLGATAKAHAADLAAAAAAGECGCGVLVSIGGDVSMAGEAPEDGWIVGIAEAHSAPDQDVEAFVALRDGGLATSGTGVRRWVRGGTTMHHIVDPRTGAPARPYWRSVTVAADSCLGSNVASTTSILRGASAPDWLASLGLSARLVTGDGERAFVGAWPGAAAEVSR
ncbi:MAG: FAD:protein FMN transferase [Ilumatobacteraceae bacterium]